MHYFFYHIETYGTLKNLKCILVYYLCTAFQQKYNVHEYIAHNLHIQLCGIWGT